MMNERDHMEPLLGEEATTATTDEASSDWDSLLGGRVRLRQPSGGYRVAIDPVMLAAAVDGWGRGGRVLDLGCGSGAAALCLAARAPDAIMVGLERLPEAAALAAANVALNGWEARISVVEGCLLDPPPAVAHCMFDHLMMNPPYLAADKATPPSDPWRAAANVESAARLADWIGFAARALVRGGALTMVHRADRLDEIMAGLSGARFGAVAVFPLWPKAGEAAKRVLVRAVAGSRAPMRLLAGLALHRDDGGYTAGARAILEEGAALDW